MPTLPLELVDDIVRDTLLLKMQESCLYVDASGACHAMLLTEDLVDFSLVRTDEYLPFYKASVVFEFNIWDKTDYFQVSWPDVLPGFIDVVQQVLDSLSTIAVRVTFMIHTSWQRHHMHYRVMFYHEFTSLYLLIDMIRSRGAQVIVFAQDDFNFFEVEEQAVAKGKGLFHYGHPAFGWLVLHRGYNTHIEVS